MTAPPPPPQWIPPPEPPSAIPSPWELIQVGFWIAVGFIPGVIALGVIVTVALTVVGMDAPELRFR